MRRREFLSAVALAPLLVRRWHPPLVRAAVVIGVDKTGSLPLLNAAVSGANMVGDWLENEGFEVIRFVKDPVKIEPIFSSIAGLVKRGTLDQLVIYFSGHGFIRDRNEMWLLSNAPGNPNEAVSLVECVDLARETAIPSVVLISDACRSAADTLNAQRVTGSVIFPNEKIQRNVRPEVDRFFAALPGDPALELPVDSTSKVFEGIYTSSFLDAFRHPQSTMVKTIDGADVVPNRTLKTFLVDDVSRRAQAKSVKLQQLPDAILECSDSTYIAHVIPTTEGTVGTTQPPPPPPPPPQPRATLGDVTATPLNRAGLGSFSTARRAFTDADLNRVATETGYGAAQRRVMTSTAPPSFETQTGFAVHGTRITRAVSSPGMRAEVLAPGDGDQQPAVIRLSPDGQAAGGVQSAASLLLEFDDGGGTVIAALQGYIGAVTVVKGLVSNVNYTPSQTNARWSKSDYDRVAELRAIVASAAKFGTFRIEGNATERARKASQLADRIRVFKAIDPSLGLYAAYAYADAGIREQIQSVHSIMRSDLNVDVFDVAMLAGALSNKPRDSVRTVPFCPMLSQGWGWLRVRNVTLSPNASKARDYLRPSLWTTFDKDAIPIILSELRPRSAATVG